MKVQEIMSKNVVYLKPEESVADAASVLARHHIGMLPVCSSDGKICGIVTDRDIVLRCIACESSPAETSLREIMTRGIVSVSPDADVREAIQNMSSQQVRRLPVVEANQVVGILSLSDLARSQNFDMETAKALSQISAQ